MKRMIVFAMALSMAMSSGALAFEPCPLAFSFLTSPQSAAQGLDVTISYMDRTFAGEVNEYGELVMELGNYGLENCAAKEFTLQVVGCENALCTKQVSFNPNGYTTIDLRDVLMNECPEPGDCCTAKFCEDAGMIHESDCPKQDTGLLGFGALIDLAVGILASGGVCAAVGIKLYKRKDGTVVKQHMHANITGYHDPNVVHKKQPHPKGQENPNYATAKSADGTYKYLG